MSTIDFTNPDNVTALKLLIEAFVFSFGFWAFFIKADWVGEFSTVFMPGSNGPVTATPGCLLKPFGLISLAMALVCAYGFATMVRGPADVNDTRKPAPKTHSSPSSK